VKKIIKLFVLFIFFFKRGERVWEHNSRVPGVTIETSAAESFCYPLPSCISVKQYIIINVYIYIVIYTGRREGGCIIAVPDKKQKIRNLDNKPFIEKTLTRDWIFTRVLHSRHRFGLHKRTCRSWFSWEAQVSHSFRT